MLKWQQDDKTLELMLGDITDQQADAIVNAANSQLAGGGGVDGAIHRRGGPAIMEETRRRYPNGCATGSAVITAAGNLSAKYVIHAVGPVWSGGQQHEAERLQSAYQTSLQLASDNACQSIMFPSLSTGAYRYPLDQASHIALTTCIHYLRTHDLPKRAGFVLFDETALTAFSQSLAALSR